MQPQPRVVAPGSLDFLYHSAVGTGTKPDDVVAELVDLEVPTDLSDAQNAALLARVQYENLLASAEQSQLGDNTVEDTFNQRLLALGTQPASALPNPAEQPLVQRKLLQLEEQLDDKTAEFLAVVEELRTLQGDDKVVRAKRQFLEAKKVELNATVESLEDRIAQLEPVHS